MITQKSGTQPDTYQLKQINRKFGMFIHFGINTFANCEWSDGSLDKSLYKPSGLDCDGWVRTAAENGMRYVIVTAKHHDGFCLWNTNTTEYGVKNTSYPQDVIALTAQACRKHGIALGIYYSLWDRNAVSYKEDFKNGYLPYMRSQITELLTNYGDICELWLDGSWDKPSSEWEFDILYDMVKQINPYCQIGINHTIGENTPNPEERYLPINCIEGDPIRMFPSDFRLWDPHPCAENDPKIYTHGGERYYLPFEMTICSRKGFSWFNSDEYENKPFTDIDETAKNCICAFSQQNNVVINMPPDKNGKLSEGDIKHLEEITRRIYPYIGFSLREKDNALTLDNGILSVTVHPDRGGNISSIYIKNKNSELLFQPPRGECPLPECGARFEEYEAAGFDDAFPNIDEERVVYKGSELTYNDHGDIWTARMNTHIDGSESVLIENNEKYLFEKRISLEGNRLILKYRIKNTSDKVYPCFYTMHCLFKYASDMHIIFPGKVKQIENVLESRSLGHRGYIHSFPVTESGFNLSCISGYAEESCEKFYAQSPIDKGCCAVVYPSKGIRVDIEWDTAALPYLGFWITKGGFRGDYNCALEPSSGYYDSISNALKNKKIWELAPNEEKYFNIAITAADIND